MDTQHGPAADPSGQRGKVNGGEAHAASENHTGGGN